MPIQGAFLGRLTVWVLSVENPMFALFVSIAKICVHATKAATNSLLSKQIKGFQRQNARFELWGKSFFLLYSVIKTLRDHTVFAKALIFKAE